MKTEQQEQILLMATVAAFHKHFTPYLAHIPNGGARNPKTGAIMKKMGVKKGMPDLIYFRARGGYFGLYIEMKRIKGGRLSKDQREVCQRLTDEGYLVREALGAEQALEMLIEYEEMDPTQQHPYGGLLS